MSWRDFEGIARDVLERHGFDAGPVDAIDLAEVEKIEVRWLASGTAHRLGRRIYIPLNTRVTRLHGVITHEIAHVLLDDYGIAQSERAARYLGAALLVPRRWLDRQLSAGWDLHGLMAFHVNASAELLARRITEVRQQASAAIYDHGRLRYRVGLGMASAAEAELVAAALATSAPVRVDDRHGAWPVFDGSWRRVVVLAGA